MSLYDKFGKDTIAYLDALNRKRQLVAINHEPTGVVVVLKSADRIKIEGATKDDASRLVGFLGFYGCGPLGLDTPAFFVKPDHYPDRADGCGLKG